MAATAAPAAGTPPDEPHPAVAAAALVIREHAELEQRLCDMQHATLSEIDGLVSALNKDHAIQASVRTLWEAVNAWIEENAIIVESGTGARLCRYFALAKAMEMQEPLLIARFTAGSSQQTQGNEHATRVAIFKTKEQTQEETAELDETLKAIDDAARSLREQPGGEQDGDATPETANGGDDMDEDGSVNARTGEGGSDDARGGGAPGGGGHGGGAGGAGGSGGVDADGDGLGGAVRIPKRRKGDQTTGRYTVGFEAKGLDLRFPNTDSTVAIGCVQLLHFDAADLAREQNTEYATNLINIGDAGRYKPDKSAAFIKNEYALHASDPKNAGQPIKWGADDKEQAARVALYAARNKIVLLEIAYTGDRVLATMVAKYHIMHGSPVALGPIGRLCAERPDFTTEYEHSTVVPFEPTGVLPAIDTAAHYTVQTEDGSGSKVTCRIRRLLVGAAMTSLVGLISGGGYIHASMTDAAPAAIHELILRRARMANPSALMLQVYRMSQKGPGGAKVHLYAVRALSAIADMAIMHLWGDGSRDVIELGTDNFTGLPLMLHKGTEAAVRRQNECESDKGRMELERYIRERGRCVFFNLHHIVDEARVGEMVLAAALRAVEKENIVRYDGFVMTKGTGGQALFTRGTVVVHTVEDVQELFQVLAASGHKPSLVQKKYEDQVQRKAPGQAEDGEDEAGGASRGSHAGSFGCSQASVRSCKSAF